MAAALGRGGQRGVGRMTFPVAIALPVFRRQPLRRYYRPDFQETSMATANGKRRGADKALHDRSIKVVILAGGLGTRLSEETALRPKPMVEIGGRPIIWHIMKIYSAHGLNDFIICLGYKGYMIKEYFSNYFMHMSDVTIDLAKNEIEVHQNFSEPWRITLVDTGQDTMTGGRLKAIERYLDPNEDFCFTYG